MPFSNFLQLILFSEIFQKQVSLIMVAQVYSVEFFIWYIPCDLSTEVFHILIFCMNVFTISCHLVFSIKSGTMLE